MFLKFYFYQRILNDPHEQVFCVDVLTNSRKIDAKELLLKTKKIKDYYVYKMLHLEYMSLVLFRQLEAIKLDVAAVEDVRNYEAIVHYHQLTLKIF